jgi:hypothetical protein
MGNGRRINRTPPSSANRTQILTQPRWPICADGPVSFLPGGPLSQRAVFISLQATEEAGLSAHPALRFWDRNVCFGNSSCPTRHLRLFPPLGCPDCQGALDLGGFSSQKLLNAPAGLVPGFDRKGRLLRFRNPSRLPQGIGMDSPDIIALVPSFHGSGLEICSQTEPLAKQFMCRRLDGQ